MLDIARVTHYPLDWRDLRPRGSRFSAPVRERAGQV